MHKGIKYIIALSALLALTAHAATAAARIDLRWTPPDTTIQPGDSTRVSIMLDDAVYFRTIDITVTYDSTLIRSLAGGQGALFSGSGFLIWDGFEESVPGLWHGFAIVLGATDSLSGPGELFTWDVEGVAEGTTAITSIETHLYGPNAWDIPDVFLDPTTLRVRWAPSAVGDLPGARAGLTLYPNPFNPLTRIGFDLPAAGPVRLCVFDARGRRVATLHEGPAAAGPLQFDWDGCDERGLVQPGGVYLFRLESPQGGEVLTAITKGLLLK